MDHRPKCKTWSSGVGADAINYNGPQRIEGMKKTF